VWLENATTSYLTPEIIGIVLGSSGAGALIKHMLEQRKKSTDDTRSDFLAISAKLAEKTKQIEDLLTSQVKELSEQIEQLEEEIRIRDKRIHEQGERIATQAVEIVMLKDALEALKARG